MNKHTLFIRILLLNLSCFFTVTTIFAQSKDMVESEASSIIQKFSEGKIPFSVELSLQKNGIGCDAFSTQVANGKLLLKGSSGVALCRAFYDYVRRQGAGICSWSGNRCEELPMNDEPLREIVSPFRDHYYLNVVTYGYTMPYWDQNRWDEEIDWMALHGIDMPLMLVATEEIMRRTFRSIGFTESDLNEYFTAPAHLPWMRMGNISGIKFDGPLPQEWNDAQVALAHHILDRMRNLGMKPICPAFAGFVPKSISKYYPSAKVVQTGWVGDNHNWRLDPTERLFHTIGTRFIEEWEKEFGKCYLYLSDSFNEMSIPNDLNTLTNYGDIIFKSIHDVNPDATWVMQGWMLGFQRNNWNPQTLSALLKNVPDNQMMILDMATDYNKHVWHNGYNWDYFEKFYNKEWVWSVIPNMGGKTAPTGYLEYYANGRLDALRSPNKGNMTGYGFAPEGTENNEIIYELLSDGGWTTDSIPLNKWLENYSMCRYGVYDQNIADYYLHLQQSAYNSFADHPRFSWQSRPALNPMGYVNLNDDYFEAYECLVKDSTLARTSPLFCQDLIEGVSLYTSGKLHSLVTGIGGLISAGDKNLAQYKLKTLRSLMTKCDAILSKHVLHSEERWEKMAALATNNPDVRERYIRDARRLVTIWDDTLTLNDYSARMWSGLMRDYYLPRWEIFFKSLMEGNNDNCRKFDNSWIKELPQLSPVNEIEDVVSACSQLYNEAKLSVVESGKSVSEIIPSTKQKSYWYTIRSAYSGTRDCVITDPGVEDGVLRGSFAVRSPRQLWRFIEVDKNCYILESRTGRGIYIADGQPKVTSDLSKANISLRKQTNNEWNILINKNSVDGLHMSVPGNIVIWSADPSMRGSLWKIEAIDEIEIPAPSAVEYDALIDELNNLRSQVGDDIGQIRSEADIDAAIADVVEWEKTEKFTDYDDFELAVIALKSGLLRIPKPTLFDGSYALRIHGTKSIDNRFLAYSNKSSTFKIVRNFNYRDCCMKMIPISESEVRMTNCNGQYLSGSQTTKFEEGSSEALSLRCLFSSDEVTTDSKILLATDTVIPVVAPFVIKGIHVKDYKVVNTSMTFPTPFFSGYSLIPLLQGESVDLLLEELTKAENLYEKVEQQILGDAIQCAKNVLNNFDSTMSDINKAYHNLKEQVDNCLSAIDVICKDQISAEDFESALIYDLSGRRITKNMAKNNRVYLISVKGHLLKILW